MCSLSKVGDSLALPYGNERLLLYADLYVLHAFSRSLFACLEGLPALLAS